MDIFSCFDLQNYKKNLLHYIKTYKKNIRTKIETNKQPQHYIMQF